MSASTPRGSAGADPEEAASLKRRKVRKGTHSCWECRRRKIRCQFSVDDEYRCLPCKSGGRICRSQEFVDEHPQQPPADRGMAQRLGRLEAMMAKIVDRIMPDERGSSSRVQTSSSPTSSSPPASTAEDGFRQTLDVLENSIADDTPVGLLLGLRNMNTNAQRETNMLTPESDNHNMNTNAGPSAAGRFDKICRQLHALFLPQVDVAAIVSVSSGPFFMSAQFSSFRDLIEGKTEPPNVVAVIPPVTSHPTVLARRLVQQAICIQQLGPSFDYSKLQTRTSMQQIMANIINTVTNLVTSNDDIVGTAEGIETLVLQGFWHANIGNLRKAWLSYRRAMSLSQLMGIDRGSTRSIKWVDPSSDPERRISGDALWYRINACERRLSLLLGLPIGNSDNSFTTSEACRRDTQMERLEKLHTVIAGRIVERNANKTPQAYALTQAIDCDLDAGAQLLDADWWLEPTLDPLGPTMVANLGQMSHLLTQINHYELQILLHLPYMLRDPAESRYDYSKAACTRASREVLRRFITFRKIVNTAFSCRHVDYSALISSMTLLLSYLRQHQETEGNGQVQQRPTCQQRQEDRKLVEMVRERMQHVAVINQDKLSQESADILGQMMPILDTIDQSLLAGVSAESNINALKCLHLNIPFLGTINLHPHMVGNAPCPTTGRSGQSAASASLSPSATPMAPAIPGFDVNAVHQMLNPLATSSVTPAMPSASMPAQAQAQAQAQAMDWSSMDPSLLPKVDGMMMQFEPQQQDVTYEFPDMTAEVEDWAFQGVDTAYWSLLNSTGMDFSAG